MEKRRLGSSELKISPVILGAWAMGGWYWGGTDDVLATRAIRTAIDEGITCIDTAPMYGMGHSEEVVGSAVKDIRDTLVLATKCGLRWDTEEGTQYFSTTYEGTTYSVTKNLQKESIITECERSLKRLQTDYIDLYQCHWPDPSTSLDETMDALLTLQSQGKIRATGVSNFTSDMMRTCSAYGAIASDQPKYSLLARDCENDVLPFCRQNNIGVIVYSPLEQGLLTGKVTVDREFPEDDYRTNSHLFKKKNRKKILDALEYVRPVADAHNATLAQVAINWTINEPGVTAAIVGARTPEQAIENAHATDFTLSDDEQQHIRTVFEALNFSE